MKTFAFPPGEIFKREAIKVRLKTIKARDRMMSAVVSLARILFIIETGLNSNYFNELQFSIKLSCACGAPPRMKIHL
jgi:hypothetical protein